MARRYIHRPGKAAPQYIGNKNRPINSVRNLQRALNREERERRAAEAAGA